ncbi:hypothetical protein [Natrinema sp. 74]|uniref:hypothetical protein n=1 Tax=Natrinema sp. 74 TaxID=3384159 RepID=UPI0038D476C9
MVGREETVDDKQILEFVEASSDPIVTTAEVADHFEFSNSGILKRLHPLSDSNLLGSKEAGRTYVWWITDKGQKSLSDELNAGEIE